MHYRALSLLLGFFVATTTISIAQFGEYNLRADAQNLDGNFHSRISGVVTAADGTPLNNIRIEVHRIGTGAIAGSSFSHMNGSFEIDNLHPGDYEVVAVEGVSETREQLRVQSQMTSLNMRMPGAPASSLPHYGT